MSEHLRFMQAALALGRRSMGRAAPNPSVGSLVVKDGVVLGRGVTAPGGRPHAEPQALAEAGEAARGATLYVTLEPCSHHGRTPPCVDAILEAGIARVVVAIGDPDPRVAGSGVARLRAHGIEVIENVGAAQARDDHCGHISRVTQGRPMVTVKMAETADGFAASQPGEPRLMITGALANARVQMMRATHDAILVGIGTALEDDPLLTVRVPGLRAAPLRIVLDRRLALLTQARLFATTAAAPVLIVASDQASSEAGAALSRDGVEIVRLPGADAAFDLPAVLATLGQRGLTRVLCEGGPRLASSLILAGLADRVVIFTSDAEIGRAGRPALTPAARALLHNPICYTCTDEVRLGSDLMRVYARVEAACSPD